MPNLPAAAWHKSSYSAHNGSCVEVAFADTLVGVRDSKNADAGQLILAAVGWTALISIVKDDGRPAHHFA